MRRVELLWEIGDLPFHIGTRTAPTNGDGVPDLLPLNIGVDEQTGALAQMPDPEVSRSLEQAYEFGSQIGTPQSTQGLGKPGLEDYLAFLKRAVGGDFAKRKVMEIGPGAGAALHAMADAGAEVVGIEPGAGEHAYSVPVIAEPFRPEMFDQKFDLIAHYGVVEHVEEPADFLEQQLSLLEPEGVIAFSVPDCSEPLARGDVSMLVHEHWSYFDEESLLALAGAAGAEVVSSEHGEAAGARYSVWRPGATAGSSGSEAARPFVERARNSVERVREYILARAGDQTQGIFAAARFFNYQRLLGEQCPPLRYFDDDDRHWGKYYPPFPSVIEPRSALISDPVDRLFIPSWTFGERIASELRAEPALAETEVTTIAELLA